MSTQTYDMLTKVIEFNENMMETARTVMKASVMNSVEWQEAYQILRDAEDAHDAAYRARQYGFPGIEY